MGALRLMLALWVVCTHGGAFFGMNVEQAWAAVQCFFIISGFYMALILNEKYVGSGNVWLFFTNRILRLFPPYWAVLALSLSVAGIAWGWWGISLGAVETWRAHADVLGPGHHSFFALANGLIFGQTEMLYVGMDPADGRLFWTADFQAHEPLLWRFLFIPQAWSIELELCFYAIAPWVVRRSARVIFSLMAASFVVRAATYGVFHLTFDPWTYRFFPSELGLFLLGALSYKIYRSKWFSVFERSGWPRVLIAALFICTVLFPIVPVRGQIKAWPFYGLAAVTVPFLFSATKHRRFDRYVGELSYPVYIVHVLVVDICRVVLPDGLQSHRSLLACAGSVALAMVIMRWISDPLERWRQNRVVRAGDDTSAARRGRSHPDPVPPAEPALALIESSVPRGGRVSPCVPGN